MTNSHGHFAWCELMTTDTTAAEAFYSHVVGWSARDAGMPDAAYTLFLAGETPVAGMMALPQEACDHGAQPGWIGYIEVDDVDVYAGKVTEAGGAILRPAEDIPGVGRFAVAADPHGAAFVLFRSGEGMPPPQTAAMPGKGHVGWRELMAGDLEAAFAFYSGLFGWTKGEAMDMGADGVYQLFGIRGGDPIGGMMKMPQAAPAPSWSYYFHVDAIKAAVERIKAGGGTVINGPMEVPGGAWIVVGLDPQGAIFALVGPQG